jgi:plasmid stability protein
MVQIRHVPDGVHRQLKAQAAEEGLSLSDYLRQQVEIIAKRPTMKEIVARLEALPPVPMTESPAELVRAGREERDRELDQALKSASKRHQPTSLSNAGRAHDRS